MKTFSIHNAGSLTIVSLPSDLWLRREWHSDLLPAMEPHRAAILEERVILDFSAVDHVTSKTVYCLLLVRSHFVGDKEMPLHLALPSTTSRRVFEILKLPPFMFTIYDSVDDAVEQLESR